MVKTFDYEPPQRERPHRDVRTAALIVMAAVFFVVCAVVGAFFWFANN